MDVFTLEKTIKNVLDDYLNSQGVELENKEDILEILEAL